MIQFGCARIKEFLACYSEHVLRLTVNNGLVTVYPGTEVFREWENQPPLYPLNSTQHMNDLFRDYRPEFKNLRTRRESP